MPDNETNTEWSDWLCKPISHPRLAVLPERFRRDSELLRDSGYVLGLQKANEKLNVSVMELEIENAKLKGMLISNSI